MSKAVQDWCIAHGMEPLAPEPYRSKTVVTVKNAHNWVIGDLNKFLLTKGMRIANGYGKLKDSTLRVATMGETSLADVKALLAAFDEWEKLPK